MNNSDSAMIDLLRCFFASCEGAFRFLEEDYGYSYISGLAEYRANYQIIVPFKEQSVTQDFLAITRYELEHHSFELLFSSDHFALDGYVYFDPVQRFEFSEILLAARKQSVEVPLQIGLAHEDMVEGTLQQTAQIIRDHIEHYIEDNPKLINRAVTIRNKRMEQAIRKQFQMQLAAVCKRAAKAFLDKNYKQVISLLQPLELYLEAADLKKLKLARKYLLS